MVVMTSPWLVRRNLQPLALERLQLELQVLKKADQLSTAFLDAPQRVDANDVCGHQFVELDPRRQRRAAAGRKQIRHLRAGEMAGKANDNAIVLLGNLNPAEHSARSAKGMPPHTACFPGNFAADHQYWPRT
ncbi:MAG TPA: hypothetical protein VFZ38_13000 [Vicinamibacterales bacterium]